MLVVPAVVVSFTAYFDSYLGVRMKFTLLLLAALAGCGGAMEPLDDNHGYGYSFDETAADGLRVRYANDSPPKIALLDDIYIAVATCMNVAILPTGPLIIFKDALVASAGHDGMIFLDTDTIILDSQITTLDWNANAPIAAPQYVIKHELVHHLLEKTGLQRDLNNAHESPFFDSCGH